MPDFIDQDRIEGGRVSDKVRTAPRCVWNYLHRSAIVLAHHPSAEEITTEFFVLKANSCKSCAQYMRGQMMEFSAVLQKEIKKLVEKVSLSL
jgi:hypothetical protein